jgi:UDP-N-acetylmuramyl pentapeptide phosphotransferase/UDP-N-acetylglucosamine-1-phosphate transferase
VWPAISASLISFLIATLAVGWLARARVAQLAIDEPNARSLHTTPVPRTGGIGMLLGIAAGWMLIGHGFPWPVWVAAAVVTTVSLLDDLRGLSAAVRLAAHLLAAALAAMTLFVSEAPLLLAGAILAISWMSNLYNFMDGSDGLAGGMTLFGFLAYAVAALLAGSTQFALLNLVIASAAAGFLVHNFYPARIFLGDAGAVPAGFLAATFGLTGWLQHDWAWWFPLLVFSPFIVDASVTLLRRLLTGARVWEAHRDHYYQRLVLLGLGHRGTAFIEYAMMGTCAVAGLWALTLGKPLQYTLLAAVAFAYVIAIIFIERAWKTRPDTHA